MLDDLNQHAKDEVAFQDRLPYVLDLLLGVTRSINEESRGHRTSQFSNWWRAADRSVRDAIQDLRNAELKRVESRAKQKIVVEMRGYGGRPARSSALVEGVRMEDVSLTASQVSIEVSTEWRFTGGDLNDRPVLPTLVRYWNDVGAVLAQAEQLLDAAS